MVCGKCGKQIRDGIAFCPFCGNDVKTGDALHTQNSNKKQTENNNSKNNKSNGVYTKSKRSVIKPIIIGAIALVVLAFILVIAIMLIGRNKEQTLSKFVKAYTAEDEDKMLTAMFPKDTIRDAELYMADKDINLLRECDDLFADYDVEELEITATEEADKALCLDFEVLLDKMDIELEYKELTIVTLSDSSADTEAVVKNSNLEDGTIKVLMYRSGNKWYILPNALEDIIEKRQGEDIESAQSIYSAITSAIANEAEFDAMIPYFGVAISLTDDFEYLPQAFQDYLLSDIKYIPELSHTTDGATGFAFMIDEYGDVTIYISSDTRVDEWEVYPSASPDYYSGKKHELLEEEVGNANLDKQFSYVRLISGQSPILGYWQSEGMGMYIGYNASGGDEGFTVYTTAGIFHPYNHYSCKGKCGYIKYEYEYYTEVFEVIVNDAEHITVRLQYEDSEPEEYEFERNTVDKDTLEQFTGVWIDGGVLYNLGSDFGNELELIYDEKCGCIHEADYEEREYMNYHNDEFITLYDGVKTISYIFPDKGLYYELDNCVGYSVEAYSINGNELVYDEFRVGGGGGMAYTYFRKDSDEAKMVEVLNAYYEYMGEGDRQYALIYVNDDDIPELYYSNNDLTGNGVLAYCKNAGKIVSLDGASSDIYSYKEREGIIFDYFGMHQNAPRTYYRLADDGSKFEILSEASAVYLEDGYEECIIDGQSVDGQAFLDYEKKYGELKNMPTILYNSIFKAYENLGKENFSTYEAYITKFELADGVLTVETEDGKSISYPVAEDCRWEETAFEEVLSTMTYEEFKGEIESAREIYLSIQELNSPYELYIEIQDGVIVRVYNQHV